MTLGRLLAKAHTLQIMRIHTGEKPYKYEYGKAFTLFGNC